MMIKPKERYIVDEKGNRVGVILDIEDYHKLLAELESIRAHKTAKASGNEVTPLESIKKARGFLKGIDTTIKREPDRI